MVEATHTKANTMLNFYTATCVTILVALKSPFVRRKAKQLRDDINEAKANSTSKIPTPRFSSVG